MPDLLTRGDICNHCLCPTAQPMNKNDSPALRLCHFDLAVWLVSSQRTLGEADAPRSTLVKHREDLSNCLPPNE